jgi:aspartate kinase
MRIFKFGGASVKDANAVRNVKTILDLFPAEKIVVVVSAMGKTTNSLEKVAKYRWENSQANFISEVEQLMQFHGELLGQLIENKKSPIYRELDFIFTQLKNRYYLEKESDFDVEYDQIVSLGEIISTKIVAAYLSLCCKKSMWGDVREMIFADNSYRNAEIDWNKSTSAVNEKLNTYFQSFDLLVVQGFIASSAEGKTITLGREGSDYTAGILAFCANASDVTIWKDVPGMLNADPKFFRDTVKLEKISFREAIELAYYGASVIHPKTVQPLQNKNIPLWVKSFLQPQEKGTIIQSSTERDHLIPSYIFKHNQLLVSISPKDFSFVVEKNLSAIFEILHRLNAKINIMQNSALSFSFLLDAEKVELEKLILSFSDNYEVRYNEKVELITIRHYDQHTIEQVTEGKKILLEQRTRDTTRIVVK